MIGAMKLLRKSNKSNKNRNNKETLLKELREEYAKLSKSLVTTRKSIRRINEIEKNEGIKVWPQSSVTLTRIAKRAENLMSALREWFGERK